jgi:hypothetical protein
MKRLVKWKYGNYQYAIKTLLNQKAQQTVKSAGLLLVVLYITSRMLFEVLGDSASLVSIGRREFAI